MYRNLYDHKFFVAGAADTTSTAPELEKVTTQATPQE
jgi:hypothetical protein